MSHMPIIQHITVLGDISSPRLDDLAPLLLLGALLVVVGIGGVFLGLILRQGRRATTETLPKSAGPFWRYLHIRRHDFTRRLASRHYPDHAHVVSRNAIQSLN